MNACGVKFNSDGIKVSRNQNYPDEQTELYLFDTNACLKDILDDILPSNLILKKLAESLRFTRFG